MMITDTPIGNADSRLKGHHGKVTHPVLPYERVYCANCSKEYGWVSHESSVTISVMNIIVICDVCEEKFGKPKLEEAKIEMRK